MFVEVYAHREYFPEKKIEKMFRKFFGKFKVSRNND
jgi:hypothetical protein